MTEVASRPGMILGVGRFYHDPRGSVRAVKAGHPKESTLLAWLMIGLLILLVGRLVALSSTVPSESPDFLPQAGAAVFGLIFLAPLLWYLLAAFTTLAAWLFRGRGGWRDGRLAVFWATLVSAPILAISEVGAGQAAGFGKPVATAVAQIGPVFFAWALAQCLTEAFGFTRAWVVFAVIALLVLALVAVPLYTMSR
ncbi:MAG: YIP1 family protein [Paracoccaceae bacterium]